MFPECPDERKDRPRDKSARDRPSQRNTGSTRPRRQYGFVIAGVGCVAARRRSRPSDIHLAGGAAKVQKRRTTFSCSSPSPTDQRTKETVGRWQCLMKYECPPCPSRSNEGSRRSPQAAQPGHCVPPFREELRQEFGRDKRSLKL